MNCELVNSGRDFLAPSLDKKGPESIVSLVQLPVEATAYKELPEGADLGVTGTDSDPGAVYKEDMMRRAFFLFTALAILALPAVIYAAGPHDNDCTECHSLHEAKGAPAFGVVPNTTEKYIGTGQTVSGTDALCLGCHNEDEGIMPIHLTKSHPVGIKPQKAFVPQEVLGNNGELTCGSCHDPHPSNPNFKYLRIGTNGGRNMGAFCAYCHEAMVDKNEL